MEQSPFREANNRSAGQDIPLLLWIPKIHYRFHNSPLLVPIVSQMNPDHVLTLYFS